MLPLMELEPLRMSALPSTKMTPWVPTGTLNPTPAWKAVLPTLAPYTGRV